MDGRRFIDSIFASEKARPITQVVMNLPNDAAEFLGTQSYIYIITSGKEFCPKVDLSF